MEEKSWFLLSIQYLLEEQAEISKILNKLLEWCIDKDEHGKHIPRDEDKVKNLNEMLRDLQEAQEEANRHLKFVVSMLQEAVSQHDDGESAGPSDHNDHGGDDQNVPAAADDDKTVSVGKAPEIATSSPSSGSSSSGNEA